MVPLTVNAAQGEQPPNRKEMTTSASYAYMPNLDDFYPAASRAAGEAGITRVRICFDTKGRVDRTELFRSSGFARLDEAAVRAAGEVVMNPPTVLGIPQADCVVLPVKFSMPDPTRNPPAVTDSSSFSSAPAAELIYVPDLLPFYQPASKKLGESGTAVVLVCYNTKGVVVSSELYSSSGFERIDESAVRAGRKVRLKPATVDGQPREGCGAVPLKFTLDRLPPPPRPR